MKFEPLEFNHIQIQNTYEFIEFQFELLEANSDNKDYLALLKRLSGILFDLWVAVNIKINQVGEINQNNI